MKLKIKFLAVILVLMLFSGCTAARNIISNVTQQKPTSESIISNMPGLNYKVEEALKNGEKSVTLDVSASDKQINTMMSTLSPFWGLPTEYTVIKKFKGVKTDNGISDITRINFKLEQSDNYYVYKAYTDKSYVIPKTQKRAAKIYSVLPGILAEIDKLAAQSSGNHTYITALAIHDWLISNLSYDETIDQVSCQNGTYGALIDHNTMCLGYAEAMQLLMICKGENNIIMIVGEGDSGDGNWFGHAWNLVDIGDEMMHVDATFDDPKNNKPGELSHIYFGQNDNFMKRDHRWEAAYYPTSASEDYYYFRVNGLYTKDKAEFRKVLRKYIKKNKPTEFEIVAAGFKLNDSDLQFIYSIDDQISGIYRVYTEEGNDTVARFILTYDE